MRSNTMMIAIAIGVAVGLILTIFILKAINNDGKTKTKYDEMQKLNRGKAYQYGFWTMVACELLMCILSSGEIELPLAGYALHFLIIMIGILVQVSYCIWTDAYIGLNNNIGRFGVACVVIALVNFAIAGISMAQGRFFVQGQLQSTFSNLLCGVAFIVIGVEILLKKIADNGGRED